MSSKEGVFESARHQSTARVLHAFASLWWYFTPKHQHRWSVSAAKRFCWRYRRPNDFL